MEESVAVAQASRPHRRRVIAAVAMLAFCCVWWGYSFPTMKLAMESWDRTARRLADDGTGMAVGLRATFLGWRFAAAAGLYALLTCVHQRGYSRRDVAAGAFVGLLMGFGMFFQLIGLRYTLPSISAFVTALPVILAPVGQAMIFRGRVGGWVWLAAGVALVGILVLSLGGGEAAAINTVTLAPPFPALGEILTVIATLFFTAQILAVDRLAPRANVVHLTTVMLAVVAVVNSLGGAMLAGHAIYRPSMLGALLADRALWWALPTLVVLSTVVALHLMNVYQPRVSAATASVVYCLEPVLATAFSIAMGTELLTPITIVGGATVLAAVLMVARAASCSQAKITGEH